MPVRIDVSEYRRSHAVAPRGWGRWMFTFNGEPVNLGSFAVTGTFTQARDGATREAKRRGATLATVCP
jgi:hypothetical protein